MTVKVIFLLPLLEVTIEDSAGETFPADPDTFQHTVTPQLVDDQEVLHQTCHIFLSDMMNKIIQETIFNLTCLFVSKGF